LKKCLFEIENQLIVYLKTAGMHEDVTPTGLISCDTVLPTKMPPRWGFPLIICIAWW
jgi:hypothetical protein